jgi:hypothetical protein
MMQFFTSKQVIEKEEHGIPTCVLFIDCEKAYDTEDKEKLFALLETRNIGKDLINKIKALYHMLL